MQAYGFIETKGSLASVEALDTMLKTANVSLVTKEFVGSGIVCVIVSGDVGAVKAAVEAGIVCVKNLSSELLLSFNVIPRVAEEVEKLLFNSQIKEENEKEIEVKAEFQKEPKLVSETEIKNEENKIKEEKIVKKYFLTKEDVDLLVEEVGFEKAIKELKKIKVADLRNLIKKYKDLTKKNQKLIKANKNTIIQEFLNYYREENK